jgi:hypothetical protein
MIAYNTWDNIARNNGRNDEEEQVKLVQWIPARTGFFRHD